MNDNKIKEAGLLLGEPFAIEFSDYTKKSRSNLMLASVLAIALIANNLKLTADSSLLGLKLESFSMEIIYQLLLFLCAYHLVHFTWLAWDNFLKWKLRLTGSHRIHEGGFADSISDNKPNPSQTTLYYWWKKEVQTLTVQKEEINSILNLLGNNSIDTHLGVEKNVVRGDIAEINRNVQNLSNNFNKFSEILESNRIPASLGKFNKWFFYMHTSQSIRWILIELLLPLILGIVAIYFLYGKVFAW